MTDIYPVVSVRGEASLEVDPEIATITATVRCVHRDREVALSDLQLRQIALVDVIEASGSIVERRSNSGLWVQPIVKGREQKAAAYTAQISTTIVVRDLVAVGEFALRAAALDDVQIHGPRWGLRDESPAYAEVRLLAARQAVERARQYAAALGGQLVGLIELADTGLLGASEPAPPMARTFLMGAPAHAGDEPEGLDLAPQRQRVQASVEARFTMTQPDLSGHRS